MSLAKHAKRRYEKKSGQTLIFMALVILMMAFAALFYFDLNKTLHIKGISRNGADAAALSAARWQAISLNIIGSLNIVAAASVIDDLTSGAIRPSDDTELISDLHKRMSFSGPLMGYVSAQQAGKQNGLFNNSDFENTTRSEILDFERMLDRDRPPHFRASGSYASATDELLAMISLLPDQGMAVRTSAQYPDFPYHLLLDPSFYDAIAGRNWCWFYYNAPSELQNYNNWQDWDLTPADIYAIFENLPIRFNSPYLTLWLYWDPIIDHLFFPVTVPPGASWENVMDNLTIELQNFYDNDAPDLQNFFEFNTEWAYYDQSKWSSWSGSLHENFPWDGEIRPEIDHGGADAAFEILAENERFTRGFEGDEVSGNQVIDRIHTTAAAKPFGTLDSDVGDVPANYYDLVLPAFNDVRLIPLGSSRSGGDDQLRDGWIEFVRDFLPGYLTNGPAYFDARGIDNFYANQLRTWEDPSFRAEGVSWLLDNSGRCNLPSGGSGGSSGGTSHGH